MSLIEHVTAENHNLLDDPIMAEKALKAIDGWQRGITKIGEIILEAGLQDTLSVRLIHRHHTLVPGQLMVEVQGVHRGGEALITEVRHERDVVLDQLMPNVMLASKNGFGAIEYCDPEILTDKRRAEVALSDKDLLQRLRSAIQEHGLENCVGIGLCNKKYFDRGNHELMLIEVTDVDDKANVLRWLPRKVADSRSIQTLWVFEGRKDAAYNNASLRAFCSWDNHGSCMVYCITVCETASPGHAQFHERPHAPSEY